MGRGHVTRLFACVLAAAMLTVLAACGGDAESADGGASSTIDLTVDGEQVDEASADAAEADTGEESPEPAAEDSEEAAADDQAQEQDGLDQAPPVVVTQTSFGAAELCMTRDDLEAALPELVVGPYEEQGFLVDTEGVTVTDGDGNVEFYAMAIVGEGPNLSLFSSDNTRYQTAEGVGPGTELAIAASLYGPATLSYNVEGESREYVEFLAGPSDISFRTGSGPEAGIYATEDSFNETEEYDPQAPIRSIDIISSDC